MNSNLIESGLFTDTRTYKTANVLIVDDDIDSAILVESVFAHLGCPTLLTLSSREAKKKMCSHKADLIILDWVLDRHTDGGGIIDECAKVFSKFKDKNERWRRPKIITYSSLDESEIEINKNPYFEHLAHWKKPIPQRELLARALGLLEKIAQ